MPKLFPLFILLFLFPCFLIFKLLNNISISICVCNIFKNATKSSNFFSQRFSKNSFVSLIFSKSFKSISSYSSNTSIKVLFLPLFDEAKLYLSSINFLFMPSICVKLISGKGFFINLLLVLILLLFILFVSLLFDLLFLFIEFILLLFIIIFPTIDKALPLGFPSTEDECPGLRR